ncbi:hypothetical protein ACWIUD_10090 [Helicobacter sp. 23-1044]
MCEMYEIRRICGDFCEFRGRIFALDSANYYGEILAKFIFYAKILPLFLKS